MKRSEHTIPDASALSAWRKSTYSGGDSGDCLEVTPTALPAHIPVRDSKNPTGPALVFPTPAWQAFVTSLGRTRP
ncbi:DUF397 domain-containing protein [Streptomyces sp. NPDC046862]|uniref:DUF397 domain-containing protein n=1 Tax=Streptomyces sp. NPDC046862 TaxID=3154603 RepID=UPI0034538DD6